ncbi:MAG: LapA family protein [Nitrospinae bacterium]|nr:LapA family protein [Nitrospinota bacterium]MCY4383220.1 LapA family protein [Nitrospinota bacterium]
MGSLRLIIGLILALAISSFGVINMKPVTVAYYQGSFNLPLFYVLLAVFACGFMVAWLGGALDRLKFRNQIGKLKREVKTMEINLDEVREKSGKLLAMENPQTEESATSSNKLASQTDSKPQMSLSPRDSKLD